MLTKSDIIQKYFPPYKYWEEWKKEWWMKKGYRLPRLPPYEKATTLQVPYQRSTLPHRLPTPQEIAEAVDVQRQLWGHRTIIGEPVVQMFDVYVVKVGGINLLQEAENLLYLEKNCTVRAPKLYAAFMSPWIDSNTGKKTDHSVCYIVLEYIRGDSVQNQITLLSPYEQERVAASFAEQMKLLRSVQPNSSHFGRIYNQAWLPAWFLLWKHDKDPNMIGPFSTYHKWLSRLTDCAYISAACSTFVKDLNPVQVDTLDQFWPKLSEASSRPTLTHHNLKYENMVVQGAGVGRPSVVIIDWRYLSWQPAWMDAASLLIKTAGGPPEEVEATNRWNRVVEQSGIFSDTDLKAAKFFVKAKRNLGISFG